MDSPVAAARRQPWPSLWATALVSLLAQLALCQFFSFGQRVPISIDVNPCNLWKYAYHFPPRGEFLTLNWFGIANLPPPLNPVGLAAAHLSPWFFFTTYAPLIATCALLAMVAVLRELDLSRPAALFGGVIYAWQGDLLPFVFPGHYGYITTWPFFALAAWGALRSRRHWAYALIAGASCGLMVGLQPDRGSIASLLIAALYLAPACFGRAPWLAQIRPLILCIVTAVLISFAGFLALFQTNITGVKLGGATNREQAFAVATQYSLSPADTMTYLVPGFFGWYNGSENGPYWGLIGQTPGWEQTHQGTRNLNLAISTTGTAASILALLGVCLLLPGSNRYFGSQGSTTKRPFHWMSSGSGSTILGPGGTFPRAPVERQADAPTRSEPEEITPTLTDRQMVYGRTFLILGAISLVLAWGYHTPLYRPLFALPLMDKWRNPLKWLEIFNFAAVVLAAFGAQHLVRSIVEERLRHALVLFLCVANSVLFILMLSSYPLAIVVAAGLGEGGGYDATGIANVMHTLHVSLGFALLIGLLLWLVLAGAWRGDRLRQWQIVNPWLRSFWFRALSPENRAATFAVCLAALAVLQLNWVAGKFLVTPLQEQGEPDLARFTATNPLLQALKDEGPTVRVAVPAPQPPLLNFFLQNQFAADRISSIDISAASRIPDALANFVNAFNGHPERLWLLGGVKNVAIAEQDLATLRQDPELAANIDKAGGYTLGPAPDDQPTHALVRLRDWFAKATFIPRASVLSTDNALLKRLADLKWNPRDSVLLTTVAPGEVDSKSAVEAAIANPAVHGPFAPVQVTRYTPHGIDLRVNTPIDGYVLINDQFDPDWQAEVNGKHAPLLRADYLLRAVAVEPGTSNIKLRYVAHYRLGSLALPVVATNNFCDAAMLLTWIVAAIALWREQRKSPSRSEGL
jgi:hypothetical protein